MYRFLAFSMMMLFLLGCSANQPSGVDVYGTNAAAMVALEQSRMLMTVTAEARAYPMTQFAMQQVAWTATVQASNTMTAIPKTATAMAWTPTPEPTATPDHPATATAVQIANDIEISNLQVERAQRTNMLFAASPYIVGFVSLALLVMGGVAMAMRISKIPMPIDQRGNPQPMLDVIDGKFMDVFSQRVQIMPQISTRLPKNALPAPVSDVVVRTETLERPAWAMADQWQGGTALPYGLTADGLGLMDLNQHPHSAAIGKTGSGKSRRFLRPMITFALAAGQRVVILGKSVDFFPFAAHPNCTIIPVRELTIESEAKRYAQFLRAMVEEMNRRDEYLTTHQSSTWAMAGRESTLVVLDEFGNALDMMPREFAEQSMRYTRGLVKEGRKVGFNLMIATQRAKGLRDIITQMGRAVFFVEDEQESRYALGTPGAESLHDGYFLSRFGAQRLAGAFEPSDGEITAFLRKRTTSPLEPPTWIEHQPILEIEPPQQSNEVNEASEDKGDDIARLAESIRGKWFFGMSKSAVSRLLGYPQYGGSYKSKTDAVVEYLMSTTTTTTDKKVDEMPVFGLVGA